MHRPLYLAAPSTEARGLSWLFKGLLQLCFPTACLVCGTAVKLSTDLLICIDCEKKLDFAREPYCPGCGIVHLHAGGGNRFCGVCLTTEYSFSRARSVLRYQETSAAIVQSLKYGKKRWALKTMVNLARKVPYISDLSEPDIIVPVPLHPARLRERGFNQALLLARFFFPHWRDRIQAQALERTQQAPPQASLGGRARREHILGAFTVRQPGTIQGRTVILVDDVMTTGATANECAKALYRAGAARVELFTFARVWDD